MSNSADGNNNQYTVLTKVEAAGGVVRSAGNPPEPAESKNEDELVLIGKGAFGTVYQACERGNRGERYALKKILTALNKDDEDAALNEAWILSQLKHKYVVSYYGHWVEGDGPTRTLFIRMELCSGGSLSDAIQKGLGPERACWIIYKVLKALNYMHQRGFVHCDLSPQNICFDGEGNPKIIDFGLAEKLDVILSQTEKVRYKGPDAKIVEYDIRDVGEMMLELFFGPFDSEKARKRAVIQLEEETTSPFDYSGHFVPPVHHLVRTLMCGNLAELPKSLTTEVSPEEESYSWEQDIGDEDDEEEDVEDLAEAVMQLKIETSPFDRSWHCEPPVRDQLWTLPNDDLAKLPEPPMTEVSSEEESYSWEQDVEEDLSSNEPSAAEEQEHIGFSIFETVFRPFGICLPLLVILIVLFVLVLMIWIHPSTQGSLFAVATLATIHKTLGYRMAYDEIVELTSRVT